MPPTTSGRRPAASAASISAPRPLGEGPGREGRRRAARTRAAGARAAPAPRASAAPLSSSSPGRPATHPPTPPRGPRPTPEAARPARSRPRSCPRPVGPNRAITSTRPVWPTPRCTRNTGDVPSPSSPPRRPPPCSRRAAAAASTRSARTPSRSRSPTRAARARFPARPKRPLALSDGALDAILALGDRPVAALLPGGRAPAYLRRDGVEVRPRAPGRAPAARQGDRSGRDPREQGRPRPPLGATEQDRSYGVQRGRHRGKLEARPAPVRRGARQDQRRRGPPRALGPHGCAGSRTAALGRGHARGRGEDRARWPARGTARGVPGQGAPRRRTRARRGARGRGRGPRLTRAGCPHLAGPARAHARRS